MKYWVIGCEEMHRIMWGEVSQLKDAFYIDSIYVKQGEWLLQIQRQLIEFWKKGLLPGFLKKFSGKCFTLNYLDYCKEGNYIILTDNRVGWYPKEYLLSLKERHHIKYVLIYLNPRAVSGKEVYDFEKIADIVFSYDKEDAEKYGFEFFPTVYSAPQLPANFLSAQDSECDLVYFGGENGRLQELLECFKVIEKSGIRYDFTVVGTEKSNRKYEDKICYSASVPYSVILDKELRSNTILEVLSSKQKGTTLRAMEAVFLNRKFVTNNADLVNMPFYDPRYMKIYNKPDEIDFDFIKKREPISYEYHGECSPIRIIERIREIDAI